jgi:hypothetical protein
VGLNDLAACSVVLLALSISVVYASRLCSPYEPTLGESVTSRQSNLAVIHSLIPYSTTPITSSRPTSLPLYTMCILYELQYACESNNAPCPLLTQHGKLCKRGSSNRHENQSLSPKPLKKAKSCMAQSGNKPRPAFQMRCAHVDRAC